VTNPLLAAALAYAGRGWAVVPLNEGQKNPWLKDWPNAASADPEQVRRWWAERPDSNVGLALGVRSGLVSVDIDTEEGIRKLEELSGGDLPDTLDMTTGKGWRLLYAIPEGLTVAVRTKCFDGADGAEAVRFQGAGAQCVMPPSIHPSGKRYLWVEGRAPEHLAPAPMPLWLQRIMCPPEPKEQAPAPRAIHVPKVERDAADVHKRAVEYLAKCPESVSGSGGHNALFWVARALVHGFALGQHEAEGMIATFFNPRCRPMTWSEEDIRHKVKEAAEKPFDKPRGWLLNSPDPARDCPPPAAAPKAQPAPSQKPWEVRPQNGAPKPGASAAELYAREFPPLKFAVDGLLTEGLTVMAGKPKGGKSWLALLLGLSVASGKPMSGRAVHQGDVLYLALEDTERRMHSRLKRIHPSLGYAIPAGLTINTGWPRADQGGLYYAAEWLEQHRKTARLLIVDTLAKFRTPQKGNANSYADDYEAIGGFKELLDAYSVSGLIVHHTRKLKSDDPFDEISGTTGISGAADTMWVLDRERGSQAGQLYLTGRDVATGTIPMTSDPDTNHWTLGGNSDGIDTTGRMGDGAKTGNQIEAAASWLRDFLKDYAFPSKEVETAAKAAGISFPSIRDAKTQIGRKGTGEMSASNRFGIGSEWWVGLGTPLPLGRLAESGGSPEVRKSGSPEVPHRRDVDGPPDDGF
jgi:hypothetical protein